MISQATTGAAAVRSALTPDYVIPSVVKWVMKSAVDRIENDQESANAEDAIVIANAANNVYMDAAEAAHQVISDLTLESLMYANNCCLART